MGGVDIYLSVDHRVIDGGPAARAIRALVAALNGPVLDELRALAGARAAVAVSPTLDQPAPKLRLPQPASSNCVTFGRS
jgi:hypothetical protein